MTPKVSIIVPVYKAEAYLHRCVNSILSQTFKDFEVLLINDGSPDKSGEICDEYAKLDKRIRVFHKENGGVSSARNVGLDNAIGDYVSFVDSDDWVDDDFLEIFLLRNADIVVQGVHATNWPNKENNVEYYIRIKEFNGTKDNVSCFLETLFDSLNIGFVFLRLYKRCIIEKNHIRFNVDYKLMEDEEFIMRYLIHCTTYSTIDRSGYHYLLPDFKDKYKHLSVVDNVKCSFSIVQSIREISNSYKGKLLVRAINYFAFCLRKALKDKNLIIDDLKPYLKEYCKCTECVKTKGLNKKNLLLLFLIKNHTPLSLIRGFNFLFSR